MVTVISLQSYFGRIASKPYMTVVCLRNKALSFILSHYQTTNLDSSKLKEFADDNFKFDKNSRKLSRRVENTVGKGEIARYEQFLLFPQCFQRARFPDASKGVIVWEWVNLYCIGRDNGYFVWRVYG